MLENLKLKMHVTTSGFDLRTFYMQNKLPESNTLYAMCAVLCSTLRQLLVSTIQKLSSKLNDLSILHFS